MQSNDICDYCIYKNACDRGSDRRYECSNGDKFKGIEVAPVIRCKDCKHALFSPKIKEGFCYCELTKAVPLTHFCGWGIPK